MTSVKKVDQIDHNFDFKQIISPKWGNGYHVVKVRKDLKLANLKSKSIGILHDSSMGYLIELVADNGLQHVVQMTNSQLEDELNTSALMISDSCLFFKKPVSSVLDPINAETKEDRDFIIWEKEFTYKETKTRDLDELEEFLRNIVKQNSTVQSLRLIADELYTNAIYNAPLSKIGRQILKIVPIRKYNKPKTARIFIAKDDKRLIIGCEDQFGSLKISKLMNHVKSIYKNGVAESIRFTSSTGAGIGTYMVMQACSSYIAAVFENKKTLVMGIVPLGISSKKREGLPKNIHLIQYKGGK